MDIPLVWRGLGIFALVVVALVVVVVALCLRTRSGVGLALLLGAVAVVYVGSIAYNAPLLSDPADSLCPPRCLVGLRPALAMLADLFLFAPSGLAMLVVVALARRWIWLVAVGISLLPLPGLALVGLWPTDVHTYVVDLVPFTAALFVPILVALTYALAPDLSYQRRD